MAESKKTIKNNISQVRILITSSSHWDSDLKQSWGNIYWNSVVTWHGETTGGRKHALLSLLIAPLAMASQYKPNQKPKGKGSSYRPLRSTFYTQSKMESTYEGSNWRIIQSIFSMKDWASSSWFYVQLN